MSAAASPASARSAKAGRQARHLAQSIVLEESGPSALIRVGLMLVCGLVVAFLVWAGLTEVKEVAHAPGTVVPSSNLQVVQHKEGGIVREVLAEKGQLVERGAVLMRLDPVVARSELERLLTRRVSLRLKAERLRAFGDGRAPDFSFADARYAALVDDQGRILELQQEEYAASREVMLNQLESNRKQVDLVTNKIESLRRQLTLVEQQREMRRTLMIQGLSSRLHFLEVERDIERLNGEITELTNQVTVAERQRAEIASRLSEFEATKRRGALDEVGDVSAEISEVDQMIAAESDRMSRLEIIAPSRGLVQDLKVQTSGAVVQPGGAVLTLVPIDDALIVESRIQTRDVGHVRAGQPVTVKVTAYDFARYGSVEGVLTDVSPTTFLDEQTGLPYYKGFVRLDQNHVGEREDDQPILPGMTVDTGIVTGEKTVLAYLLRPIYISLTQGFQER